MRRRSRGAMGRASAGQTLVIFALVQLVLLGSLGLAIDGGYLYMKRRAMQNVADAAAMAGAAALGQDFTDTVVTQTVLDSAARNGVTDPSQVTCRFYTNSYPGGASQACSSTGMVMSKLASPFTTVEVRVAERHPTFVMRAVGTPEAGTAALAAAQVQVPVNLKLGPFVICAIDTKIQSAPASYPGGGIFKQDGVHDTYGPPKYERVDGDASCWGEECGKTDDEGAQVPQFNERAFAYADGSLRRLKDNNGNNILGPTFLIHHPSGIELCNNNSSSFKGINDKEIIASFPPGQNYWQQEQFTIEVTTGNITSVQSTVEGINGCKAGAKIDDCIMILPVVDNYGPGGQGTVAWMSLRTVQAFYIRELANGAHTGELIKNYFTVAESGAFYVPGSQVPKVLRLIK